MPNINLSLDTSNHSDTENNQGDNELESQSSLSYSSEDELLDMKEDENAKSRFQKRRKNFIPLRDRLRNLRHRRTMNMTEQSDYKSVLDSLKVVNGGQEIGANSTIRLVE